jgi:transcriptional regulator with XRE-family HTH domain
MNDLQRLIAQHCTDTGDSVADLAHRAGLSRQTVSALLHRDDPKGIPSRTTLAKLAAGLDLPTHTVLLAAADQLGEDSTEQRLAALLEVAGRLGEDQLHALLVMARLFESQGPK